MFDVGDIVYVSNAPTSALSMTHYAEHSNEFSCPCSWRNEQGRVTRLKGNYVYIEDLTNPTRHTAFHFRDLKLVRRGEVEV